ncbi:hypothetical protein [Bacillus sp. S14(2024)]|uniref:hypothetical protein n=1 Tax=Bacillus sp. S14(2024) TaxID=3162884 RepID=UPI003D1AB92A
MVIYERYANLLLELHKAFHQLILTEFNKPEEFNSLFWENNLNEDLKGKITYYWYPSQWNDKKIIIRPAYKVYESSNYGPFFIEYRSYSGKVSKNIYDKTVNRISYIKKKYKDNAQEMQEKLNSLVRIKTDRKFWTSKQSIFDFYLYTGSRYSTLYNGDATHYNLFEDLKRYSNYINCLSIWRGDDIFNNIKNQDERDALITLSWLMFEQEINYGRTDFQQNTNFVTNKIQNLNYRSRDMIMGFVNMLFSDTELYRNYPYWKKKNGIKVYPHFGKGDDKGYKNLDETYKKYFSEYNNVDKYKDVFSLLEVNDYTNKFRGFVKNANQNPYFNGLKI